MHFVTSLLPVTVGLLFRSQKDQKDFYNTIPQLEKCPLPAAEEEVATLTACEVPSGMLRRIPLAKVVSRGCAFSDGALSLSATTEYLALSACASPLEGSMFTVWNAKTREALATGIDHHAEGPWEIGLMGIMEQYLKDTPWDASEDELAEAPRQIRITDCPIAPIAPNDDKNLFRVLWHSLAFQEPDETDIEGAWLVRLFGGHKHSLLRLKNTALSLDQLQALFAAMDERATNTKARLINVAITGHPAESPLVFRGKKLLRVVHEIKHPGGEGSGSSEYACSDDAFEQLQACGALDVPQGVTVEMKATHCGEAWMKLRMRLDYELHEQMKAEEKAEEQAKEQARKRTWLKYLFTRKTQVPEVPKVPLGAAYIFVADDVANSPWDVPPTRPWAGPNGEAQWVLTPGNKKELERAGIQYSIGVEIEKE